MACLVAVMLLAGSARAQMPVSVTETKQIPPAVPHANPPQTPPSGPPAGGPPGGPPPVPVLLGIADFLITIDRPYDAEKIYQGILHMDPKNPAALAGLRDAKFAQRPTMTLLAHGYYDSHDVELFAWGGGPTFRTPYGNITLTAGTGYYKNDNKSANLKNPLGPIQNFLDDRAFSKQTLNLLLQPYYKTFEGYFFLSQVFYEGAPDRFLYDLKFTYTPEPARRRYTLTAARRDSFLQSDKNEFFAPESFYALVGGLTFDEWSLSIDHPLASRWDFTGYYANFDYSDGNHRNILRSQVMYRMLPRAHRPMPVFRVGLAHTYDNTDKFSAFYYAPQNVQSLSLAFDYVNLTRRLKYGIVGAIPFAKVRGNGFAQHDPATALFTFLNVNLTDTLELYVKAGGINSPGYDLSFRDFVVGINGRF
jgi:hypothetical protein